MPTRTKIRKNTKQPTRVQVMEVWNTLRGLLLHKGPKDVIKWQRKTRKDRKIL